MALYFRGVQGQKHQSGSQQYVDSGWDYGKNLISWERLKDEKSWGYKEQQHFKQEGSKKTKQRTDTQNKRSEKQEENQKSKRREGFNNCQH